jgi:CheY-like chemotaxis protein
MTVTPTFRILVVDENPAVRQFVDLAVGSDVVSVVGVADGLAALDSVERTPPDLVLAAMGMTGMGGHDLAARLSRRRLPVVLVTGSLDRAEADAGAAVRVLAKPLRVQQLRDLVSRMVTARPGDAASPERREESAVEASAETDVIDAWLGGADVTLGLAPARWLSLAAEPGELHSFAQDVAVFRARYVDQEPEVTQLR